MEYKVHVDAAKEDCYWQYVHPGATFYVSAQVLKGGDGSIGIGIRKYVVIMDNCLYLQFLDTYIRTATYAL